MSFRKIEFQISTISKLWVVNALFGKFDSKFNIDIFLGYSSTSKTYIVFNKITLVVEESIHATFDETNQLDQEKDIDNDIGFDISFDQIKFKAIIRKIQEMNTKKKKTFKNLSKFKMIHPYQKSGEV